MRDFDLEQQLIDARRRRYGEQAQAQAPQGRMVGGRFVAPHALEYLAAGLRGFGGIRGQQMAEDELRQLQTTRQQAVADALRGYTENMQDRPAEVLPPDVAGPPQPAQPQNIPAAFRALSTSPDAAMRQFAQQGAMQFAQKAAEQRQAEQDRQRYLSILESTKDPQKAIAAGVPRQFVVEYFEAPKIGRAEVARTVEITGANGEKLIQQLDKAGQPVGAPMPAYVAPVQASVQAQPYFQQMQTAQGVMAFNTRTGRVEPVAGSSGQPIIGAQYDPALQGSLAGSKTGATTEAKLRTEARLDAPKAIAQGEETIRLVDDLLKAPGMKQAVGASRMLGIQKIPGTSAKDFDVRLDQLKGQQFLQAFESLKGGGAITEIEGKKATDAIARMDAAGSEAEFTKAAREFQSVIRQGVARAKNAQGVQTTQPAQSAPKRLRFDAQGNVIQ